MLLISSLDKNSLSREESRKLTAAERNYPAHVLELLAVVHALRAFDTTCWGVGLRGPGTAGPTSTCGRTTRRSRGSRRTGI